MTKAYKTANGKLVDMDGLRLKNEDTIALGNMRTNARGDELGPGGKVVKTRNERMNENYKLHSMVPKDDLVHDTLESSLENSTPHKTVIETQPLAAPMYHGTIEETVLKATPGNNFGTIEVKTEPVVVSSAKKPRGGLAASVTKPGANETSIPERKIRRI